MTYKTRERVEMFRKWFKHEEIEVSDFVLGRFASRLGDYMESEKQKAVRDHIIMDYYRKHPEMNQMSPSLLPQELYEKLEPYLKSHPDTGGGSDI